MIEMLKMRGQIFVSGEEVKLRTMKKMYAPCINCEHSELCGPDNVISPTNCPYLFNW